MAYARRPPPAVEAWQDFQRAASRVAPGGPWLRFDFGWMDIETTAFAVVIHGIMRPNWVVLSGMVLQPPQPAHFVPSPHAGHVKFIASPWATSVALSMQQPARGNRIMAMSWALLDQQARVLAGALPPADAFP